MYIVTRKQFFKILSNSKAFASELLEDIEKMFSMYYIQGDMYSMF